eukprot:749489-Amorphochlora_amoeboformis.AAC.1
MDPFVSLDTPEVCLPSLLVITPTRELSLQILRVLQLLLPPPLVSISEKDFNQYNSRNEMDVMYVNLQPDVVVGTPKELVLLVNKQAIQFSNLKFLMLDEVLATISNTYKAPTNIQQRPNPYRIPNPLNPGHEPMHTNPPRTPDFTRTHAHKPGPRTQI